MILVENDDCTVEIDEEDALAVSWETLVAWAASVADVMGKYQLDTVGPTDSVAIEFDGIQLRYCPKPRQVTS